MKKTRTVCLTEDILVHFLEVCAIEHNLHQAKHGADVRASRAKAKQYMASLILLLITLHSWPVSLQAT
jgi:hypothetical protein